jgi:N6-adenosine-specific RNA methylase IME4
MTARLKIHPAAELIPVMSEGEQAELTKDIADNGQKEAIDLLEGKILDGRHRYASCVKLGIEPKTRTWSGADAIDYVLSKNLHRRHLNESQRAMIVVKAGLMRALEAKALERKKAAGGDKRLAPRGAKRSAEPERKPTMNGKAAKAAGVIVGVGTRSIERAKMIMAKRPELEPLISTGKITVKQAEKQIRREEQIKLAREYRPPEGQFEVICVDWPWEYDDAQDGAGMNRGLPYPPMPIDQICASIEKLPVAENCALFAWVTNPILLDPAAWAVVYAKLRDFWGFKAKQIRTWTKTNDEGERVTKQGWVWRNDTEHLIRLERGKPVFNQTGAKHGRPIQRTSFSAPMGEHSEKPAVAYTDIEAICASTSRLEMYARAERPGWVTSGSELPKPKKSRSNCRIEDAEANA